MAVTLETGRALQRVSSTENRYRVVTLPRFRITRERKRRPWDTRALVPLWWSIYLKHADGTESFITRYHRWQDALNHVNKAIKKFGDRR